MILRQISFIVFHCTAGPQDQKTEDILAYWKKLGWLNPGYHFEIDADGNIEELQKIEKVANGVAGHNQQSIHISYKGGVHPIGKSTPVDMRGKPVDNRTIAQKSSQLSLLKMLCPMFPRAVILGHRDFSPDKNRNGLIEPTEWIKACPAYSVRTDLSESGFMSYLPKIEMYTKTRVNLRSGFGLEFGSRAIIKKDAVVRFLGEAYGWTYVSVNGPADLTGWIRSDLLTA